ncbi:unnamed protein product, partial [Ectocarpus sp. 4 AP-2014]
TEAKCARPERWKEHLANGGGKKKKKPTGTRHKAITIMHKKYQTMFGDKHIYEGMQESTVVGWFKQRSVYMKKNLTV